MTTDLRARLGGRLALPTLDPIPHSQPSLVAMIGDGASSEEILDAARAKGFVLMREDGKRKILDGVTTPEEVFRVLA